ncbi:MAG: glycosyltransferase family 4 protein [Limisphaerales bacterium]
MHIITGLFLGGAEMMLFKLLSRWDRSRFSGAVVSLIPLGPVGERIAAQGIRVSSLNMRRGLPNPLSILRLAGQIRAFAPDVVQTWMYHADLLGGLAAQAAGRPPVVWGVHNTTLVPGKSGASAIWSARACARLSLFLPKRILCCSESARRVHGALGYDMGRMRVIPNGFDLEEFKPDPLARWAVRQELGLDANAILLGLIARFDPQKDHGTLIRASARLRDPWPQLHFVLCGEDVTWANRELADRIEKAGMRARFHLLGRRLDIPRVAAALDVACLCSAYGEAFPLVLGEAMACGVPCVVTDVGDSAAVVGETGIVVPPAEPEALAAGIDRLLEMGPEGRRKLGDAARARVLENFSLDRVVREYQGLYCQVAAEAQRSRGPAA